VVDEVLEGPASEHLFTDEEYGPDVSAETFAARPDHAKEIDFFKEPTGICRPTCLAMTKAARS